MYLGAPMTTLCPLITLVVVVDRPRISVYSTIRKGICRRLGRQAPNGLVPFSL